MPCLGYVMEFVPKSYKLHQGIHINRSIGPLPTGIVWPALIVNSLVYATSIFALTQVPPLIRWRRRRAGRCPKCNYDRTGLSSGAVCPECGTAPV